MRYVTMEVDIEHGKVLPKEPEKLPEKGTGVLTVLEPSLPVSDLPRVQLPLIRGDGKRLVNPTPEQLDASLWGCSAIH